LFAIKPFRHRYGCFEGAGGQGLRRFEGSQAVPVTPLGNWAAQGPLIWRKRVVETIEKGSIQFHHALYPDAIALAERSTRSPQDLRERRAAVMEPENLIKLEGLEEAGLWRSAGLYGQDAIQFSPRSEAPRRAPDRLTIPCAKSVCPRVRLCRRRSAARS